QDRKNQPGSDFLTLHRERCERLTQAQHRRLEQFGAGVFRAFGKTLAIQPERETVSLVRAQLQRIDALGDQPLAAGTDRLGVAERAREQQLFTIGREEAEAAVAIGLTDAGEAGRLAGLLLHGGLVLHSAADVAQTHRLAQLAKEWRGDPARLHGAGLENILKVAGLGDERMVALSRVAQLVIE